MSRGTLQAATYKKGANMKCMLLVSGGPRLANLKIQLKNKPTHLIGPCLKKKKQKKLHFFFFPFAGQTLHPGLGFFSLLNPP